MSVLYCSAEPLVCSYNGEEQEYRVDHLMCQVKFVVVVVAETSVVVSASSEEHYGSLNL